MKYVHSALIALLVLLPAICEAKENCPWLNQATALGVLEVRTSSSPAAIVEDNGYSLRFHLSGRNWISSASNFGGTVEGSNSDVEPPQD